MNKLTPSGGASAAGSSTHVESDECAVTAAYIRRDGFRRPQDCRSAGRRDGYNNVLSVCFVTYNIIGRSVVSDDAMGARVVGDVWDARGKQRVEEEGKIVGNRPKSPGEERSMKKKKKTFGRRSKPVARLLKNVRHAIIV